MDGKVRWRQGILARSLLAAVVVALLVGAVATHGVGSIVGARAHALALTRLGELLDTVERTASIACFVEDEQLGKEVAEGLLRNSEVRRVTIRVGDRELAGAERAAGKSRAAGEGDLAGAANVRTVDRVLHSPFDAALAIGSIHLEADAAVIDAWVRNNTRNVSLLLAGQIALVVGAALAALFFFVLRPIKATSDRLHRLDAAGGERLAIPRGHRNTEVGRLVGDINQLAGRLVATLEQERALRSRQEIDRRKYQDLFDHASSGIFVAERFGSIDSCNPAFIELACLPDQVGRARRLTDAHWQDPGKLLAMIGAALDGGQGACDDDFLLQGRRGDERWLRVTIAPLGDGSVQGTVTDVTQRKREELSARRLAVTDALTGLANRTGLHRRFADLRPDDGPFALVLIDLDGFRQINDALGFPVGDELLAGVAARLREFLASGDEIARIGSDEFALAWVGEGDRQALAARVERLAARLAQPYAIAARDVRTPLAVGVSMGLALYPHDGGDIQQLMRAAELALHSARSAGGCACKFYEPGLQAAAVHKRRLEDDLRAMVAGRGLDLAFQPIVNLRSGRVAGAEALLRWPHPAHGFVAPDVFVPLAEEIGLIGAIGRVALDDACRHAAQWRRGGLDIYVSVNVSARQIPADLA
ncbi:MAG: diguanylate cyclase, partial [Sulfuritalea sp.]|nr:diguanylate cyclase [Sulfuritalea sp.]